MRVGAYKGAAVVVPAQIVAQHLEGLNLRDPFWRGPFVRSLSAVCPRRLDTDKRVQGRGLVNVKPYLS